MKILGMGETAPRHLPATAIGLAGALLASGCSVLGGPDSREDERFVLERQAMWLEAEEREANRSPAPAEAPSERRVTVRAGDRLADIARRTTGSAGNWRALAEANDIDDPARLDIGQVLRIPLELSSGDTAADGASAGVDFLDLLRGAQANDPDFQLARTDFEIAQQQIPIARGDILPQVSASALAGYTELLDEDDGDGYEQTEGSITASQPLYDAVRGRTLAQAARSAQIAETQLLIEQEALILRVAERYFDVLEARAQVTFRESDLEAARRQLNQTRSRRAVGAVAGTDVAEARASSDLAEAALIEARNTLDDARERLDEITGLDTEAPLSDVDSSVDFAPPDPERVEAWLESALEANRSLQLAQANSELAAEEIDLVRAQRLPTVSLELGVNAVDNDAEFDTASPDTASAQIGIDLPLFTGGRVTAEIARERLRYRRALEDEEGITREVMRETRGAYRDVLVSISRAESLSQALVSTELAAEAVQAGFDAGTRTSAELLSAQRDVFQARADFSTARYDYLESLLSLERLSGRLSRQDVLALNGRLR